MSALVTVIDRQRRLKIKKTVLRKLAEFFLRKSGERAGIEWGEVSVVLLSDKQSRAVNYMHLGHDYATDVISFNFDPMPGEPKNVVSGEIIINVELACRLGLVYKGSNHELALYLAHGCDHLSGADDHSPELRRQMRRRELRWLQEAKEQGLRDALFLAKKVTKVSLKKYPSP